MAVPSPEKSHAIEKQTELFKEKDVDWAKLSNIDIKFQIGKKDTDPGSFLRSLKMALKTEFSDAKERESFASAIDRRAIHQGFDPHLAFVADVFRITKGALYVDMKDGSKMGVKLDPHATLETGYEEKLPEAVKKTRSAWESLREVLRHGILTDILPALTGDREAGSFENRTRIWREVMTQTEEYKGTYEQNKTMVEFLKNNQKNDDVIAKLRLPKEEKPGATPKEKKPGKETKPREKAQKEGEKPREKGDKKSKLPKGWAPVPELEDALDKPAGKSEAKPEGKAEKFDIDEIKGREKIITELNAAVTALKPEKNDVKIYQELQKSMQDFLATLNALKVEDTPNALTVTLSFEHLNKAKTTLHGLIAKYHTLNDQVRTRIASLEKVKQENKLSDKDTATIDEAVENLKLLSIGTLHAMNNATVFRTDIDGFIGKMQNELKSLRDWEFSSDKGAADIWHGRVGANPDREQYVTMLKQSMRRSLEDFKKDAKEDFENMFAGANTDVQEAFATQKDMVTRVSYATKQLESKRLQSAEVSTDAAKQHWIKGQKAYVKDDFETAAREFEAGYRLSENPAFCYNIGVAYEKGKKLQNAVEWYRAYLDSVPAAPDQKDIEDRIKRLEKK